MPNPFSQDNSKPTIGSSVGYSLPGLGLLGANRASSRLADLIKLPTSPEFYEASRLFTNSSNVNPEDFVQAYTNYGAGLAKRHVQHKGKAMPIGSALMEAKPALVRGMRKVAPEPILRKTGLLQLMHFGDDPAVAAAAMEHYKAFEKGPLGAYKQMVAELPEISMSNANHKVMRGGQVLDDLPSKWSHILSLPREQRNNALMEGSPWGIMSKNKVDFNPFFDDLSERLGLNSAEALDSAQIKKKLNSTIFGAASSPTLVGHLNDRMALTKARTVADVAASPDYINRFSNLLMAGRMRHAPKSYGKWLGFARGVNNLARPAVRNTAAGLALAGLAYPSFKNRTSQPAFDFSSYGKKASMGDHPNLNLAGGSGLGLLAARQVKRDGLRSINPFAAVRGVVLGGADTGKGSFAFQTKALNDALNAKGLKSENWAGYTVTPDEQVIGGDLYRTKPMSRRIVRNKDLDYLVQVGAHPEEGLFNHALNRRGYRYRMLSDFGDGNFKQPSSWLGGRNWMKVHDDPNNYKRFFVPGHNIAQRGRSANVVTPSIPVSDIFNKTPFQPKLAEDAFTLVGMGGGAGAPLMFPDAHRVINPGDIAREKEYFTTNARNILDDVMEATRKAHGDKARVKVMLGNALQNDTEFVDTFLKRLVKQDKRYSNVDFINAVKQDELAREYYAKARNIVQLPGSTTAELMAMPGEHTPRVVNLIPDESKWWMPKHWKSNADAFAKEFPGAKSVELGSNTRLKQLTDAFSEGLTPAVNRTAKTFDASQIAKTISRDVKLKRLGNLGKVTGAAGLGGYLINRGVRSSLSNTEELGKVMSTYGRGGSKWENFLRNMNIK
jgi:hypothetical protein